MIRMVTGRGGYHTAEKGTARVHIGGGDGIDLGFRCSKKVYSICLIPVEGLRVFDACGSLRKRRLSGIF